MATDLSVTLEDRPGEFARVTEALGSAGINIEGLCGLAAGGRGYVHVLVQDAAAARAAIEGAGLTIDAETEALVLEVGANADRPGAAGSMARKVADAGVNVLAGYMATHDRVVLVTSDNAKAREVLGI